MKKKLPGTLLYDDNCPLCAAYTQAFVKTGMLGSENRVAFSNINPSAFNIDINRARHEIPLIDTITGEVKYGIDALAEILNQKFCFVKPVLNVPPVNWFFRKLYRVISYNRTIIISDPSVKKSCFDCSPDYSFRHRWYLTLFTWTVSFLLLLQQPFAAVLSGSKGFQFTAFLMPFVVSLLLCIRKTKQQTTDILLQTGLTVMLSTFICYSAYQICISLCTFSVMHITIVTFIYTFVFIHQFYRRYHFYKNTYML